MFDWFQASLDAQKRLLDLQSRQIAVWQQMLTSAQTQNSAQLGLNKAAEAQQAILKNWLSLWGVKG